MGSFLWSCRTPEPALAKNISLNTRQCHQAQFKYFPVTQTAKFLAMQLCGLTSKWAQQAAGAPFENKDGLQPKAGPPLRLAALRCVMSLPRLTNFMILP